MQHRPLPACVAPWAEGELWLPADSAVAVRCFAGPGTGAGAAVAFDGAAQVTALAALGETAGDGEVWAGLSDASVVVVAAHRRMRLWRFRPFLRSGVQQGRLLGGVAQLHGLPALGTAEPTVAVVAASGAVAVVSALSRATVCAFADPFCSVREAPLPLPAEPSAMFGAAAALAGTGALLLWPTAVAGSSPDPAACVAAVQGPGPDASPRLEHVPLLCDGVPIACPAVLAAAAAGPCVWLALETPAGPVVAVAEPSTAAAAGRRPLELEIAVVEGSTAWLGQGPVGLMAVGASLVVATAGDSIAVVDRGGRALLQHVALDRGLGLCPLVAAAAVPGRHDLALLLDDDSMRLVALRSPTATAAPPPHPAPEPSPARALFHDPTPASAPGAWGASTPAAESADNDRAAALAVALATVEALRALEQQEAAARAAGLVAPERQGRAFFVQARDALWAWAGVGCDQGALTAGIAVREAEARALLCLAAHDGASALWLSFHRAAALEAHFAALRQLRADEAAARREVELTQWPAVAAALAASSRVLRGAAATEAAAAAAAHQQVESTQAAVEALEGSLAAKGTEAAAAQAACREASAERDEAMLLLRDLQALHRCADDGRRAEAERSAVLGAEVAVLLLGRLGQDEAIARAAAMMEEQEARAALLAPFAHAAVAATRPLHHELRAIEERCVGLVTAAVAAEEGRRETLHALEDHRRDLSDTRWHLARLQERRAHSPPRSRSAHRGPASPGRAGRDGAVESGAREMVELRAEADGLRRKLAAAESALAESQQALLAERNASAGLLRGHGAVCDAAAALARGVEAALAVSAEPDGVVAARGGLHDAMHCMAVLRRADVGGPAAEALAGLFDGVREAQAALSPQPGVGRTVCIDRAVCARLVAELHHTMRS